MKRTGRQIILDALRREEVKTIFGYPGGCVIPLFDELLNYPDLELVLVRHEQAAAHAADGYARVTGKASVVFATSGPGATNTVTGIATAAMDSVPMVIISGQVRSDVIGTDAFQETNVTGLTRPITKHNYLVKDIDQLPRILAEAFHIAQTGKPGPVLVDVPVDVQIQTSEADFPKKVNIKGYHPGLEADTLKIQKAWDMISRASKPIIYAGGGVNLSNASEELIKFAAKCGIPITTTLLGIGSIPEDHDLSLGMLGMHGNYTANTAMMTTDLVICIGARFDDRVTGMVDEFLTQAKIIHIDIDSATIDKIKKADLGIVADAKNALTKLNRHASPLETDDWLKYLRKMKEEHPLVNYNDAPGVENSLRPEYVIGQISEKTAGDAIIVTDVGQHQMFTALHYQHRQPRSNLTSGGLGTMGFGLPAALGAAVAEKERPVICISGDGGFQMNIQELATIRTYNLPVKIIIMNNSNLGMVKQWQDMFWQRRYAHTILSPYPDFIKVADAYSIPAFSTGKKEEVPGLLDKALKMEGPVLLEFRIDKDAHVYPMIPAGGRLTDIIEGS